MFFFGPKLDKKSEISPGNDENKIEAPATCLSVNTGVTGVPYIILVQPYSKINIEK